MVVARSSSCGVAMLCTCGFMSDIMLARNKWRKMSMYSKWLNVDSTDLTPLRVFKLNHQGAALSRNLTSATAVLAVNMYWRVYIQVHVERPSFGRPWCLSTGEPVISFWDHVRWDDSLFIYTLWVSIKTSTFYFVNTLVKNQLIKVILVHRISNVETVYYNWKNISIVFCEMRITYLITLHTFPQNSMSLK